MGQGRRKCRRAAWDEEGGRGQEAFPNPNWVGGEGWEEAVHMPTSVAYVTEDICIISSSHGLLHTWHWVSSGGKLSLGFGAGGMGAGGAEASCLRKWD